MFAVETETDFTIMTYPDMDTVCTITKDNDEYFENMSVITAMNHEYLAHSIDYCVWVHDMSGRLVFEYPMDNKYTIGLLFRSDGRLMILTWCSGEIQLECWMLHPTKTSPLDLGDEAVEASNWTLDDVDLSYSNALSEEYFAMNVNDSLCVYSTISGELLMRKEMPGIHKIEFCPLYKRVIVLAKKTLYSILISTGDPVELSGVRTMVISPDRTRVLVMMNNNDHRVVNVEDLSSIKEYANDGLEYCFAPDGTIMPVQSTENKTIQSVTVPDVSSVLL
jgi:hypothetical protein